ncbi:MAG TPA: hypothetical protein VJU54_10305 [Nitrospiraceae bacterium]|nr:hypothetical protein [Nitrospiraceae bacterium]
MNNLMLAVSMVVVLGAGIGILGAVDPMADKEANPTLGERFIKATVKGTLMKIDGEHYSIKDTAGREINLSMRAQNSIRSWSEIR